MARSVRESVVLAAEPQRVWETVMDPSRLERWVTTHDSYEGAAPGPLERGRRVHPEAASGRQVVQGRLAGASRPSAAARPLGGRGPGRIDRKRRLPASGGGRRHPVRLRERVRASGRRARQGGRRAACQRPRAGARPAARSSGCGRCSNETTLPDGSLPLRPAVPRQRQAAGRRAPRASRRRPARPRPPGASCGCRGRSG